MGLKNLIGDVSESIGQGIVAECVPRLTAGISLKLDSPSNKDIVKECLEILSCLLGKFGLMMRQDHARIMNAVMDLLTVGDGTVRKKAAASLSTLAVVSTDDLLFSLIDRLVRI